MSRQKLENQAKTFLLEIDQEQEINEIMNKDQKSQTRTQWINQNNLIQQNQNFVVGWNGETELLKNQSKNKQKNVKQQKQIAQTSRIYSANNDPEFLNPRYFSRNVSPQKKLNDNDNMNNQKNIPRKSSLSIQDLKKQQNNKLQRSVEYEQDVRDLGQFEKNQIGKDQLTQNRNKLTNKCQIVNEKEEDYDVNLNQQEKDIIEYNKFKNHRVYNIVKNKINMMSSPKQLDQNKLNLFEQVNSRHNQVFIPLNFTQKQNNAKNDSEQLQFLNTVNFNNPNKFNGETISDKIQQYIDQNDKSTEVFKKINEVRKNSLLFQKQNYLMNTKQTSPEFIPIEQFSDYKIKNQTSHQISLEQQNFEKYSIEQNTERLQQNSDELKLKDNFKRFLEQQNTLSQTPINKNGSIITPRNNSPLSQNKSQIQQINQNFESQQGSLQNSPNSRQYRLTPAETYRLIEHIEKQGRNYLSSSPTKIRNNQIKFRIQKKQSVIDPPTISVTQNNFNKNLNILNSIQFDDNAINTSSNMKNMILSKLSKQNNSHLIIDRQSQNATTYSSLKKQRVTNNINNESGYMQFVINNSNNRLAQNNSQLFDSSILSRNNNSSLLVDKSTVQSQNWMNDTNRHSNSQNKHRVENFFIHKHELHTAPHRNRPKMTIQKINKVKQINFDLESTLCKQSPSSSFNHFNSIEQSNNVSLSITPMKLKNNKIPQHDKMFEKSRVFFKQTSTHRSSNGMRKNDHIQSNYQTFKDFTICNSIPLSVNQSFAKTSQRWKDNPQINQTSFQQNNSRSIEKNIQLNPKQLS